MMQVARTRRLEDSTGANATAKPLMPLPKQDKSGRINQSNLRPEASLVNATGARVDTTI
jgi:hypothetical protein